MVRASQWLSGKKIHLPVQSTDWVPGLGGSPGGNGSPLQYSCLENPLYRGAWQDTVYGVAKSETQLSEHAHILIMCVCVCVYSCAEREVDRQIYRYFRGNDRSTDTYVKYKEDIN